MTRGTKFLALALIVLLGLASTSCILDEKVLEIVLRGSTCAEFEEYDEDETFATPDTIDMAEEVEDILEDAGISRDEIVEAKLIKAGYQVTDFDNTHDWVISGVITVERSTTTISGLTVTVDGTTYEFGRTTVVVDDVGVRIEAVRLVGK